MGKLVFVLCLLLGAALAAPLRDAAPTTTTITTTTTSQQQDHMQLPEETEPFFADEEANWEPYAETQQEEEAQESEFDEEYQRYLDEMSEAMLTDKALRDEIIKELSSITSEEELSKEDAELLRIASHLQDEELRTEVDEQERIVVERQRRMARRENEHELEIPIHADEVDFNDPDQGLWDNPEAHEKQLRHIAEQRLKLLTNIDETHHQAFVQREMARELRFREQLTSEPSSDKRAELAKQHKEEFERIKALHGHHPGSQQQLEEVWKETDGLTDEKFDPMVFFHLHDLSNDGYLDTKELEAIFYHEARKLHEIDGHLDELAVQEEMRRMREHVEHEADSNKDGMLSQHEFLEMTRRVDFNSDPAWNALVPEFTEEKLREFESRRRAARNRNRNWQENGEHVDEAVLAASRRLEQNVWREQHGKPRLPPHQKGRAAVHPGHPEQAHPLAGDHPPLPDHDQPQPPHPADPAAQHHPERPEHPPAPVLAEHPAQPAAVAHAVETVHAQPAAAAEHQEAVAAVAHPDPAAAAAHHDKPAEHHDQPAAAKPAAAHSEQHNGSHEPLLAQPAAEHHEAPAAVAHHDKPAEHAAQPAAPAPAAAAEHHDKPAAAAEHPAAAAAAEHPAVVAAAVAAATEHHDKPAEHAAQPAAPAPAAHHDAVPAQPAAPAPAAAAAAAEHHDKPAAHPAAAADHPAAAADHPAAAADHPAAAAAQPAAHHDAPAQPAH